MAYGNQYPPPGGNEEEKDQGEGTGGTGEKEEEFYEVGEVSFVEEHAGPLSQDKPEISIVGIDEPYVEPIDPIPSPILGQIKFQKTIYSQNAFRQKVDVSISELKPKQEELDISGFFKKYRRIFFDIPKEGYDSHNTLIKESMDYMNDFKDPKDEQISNLESQVEALNTRINNHIVGDELIESVGDLEDLGAIIEDQAEEQEAAALKAQADAEIGDPNDPNIYWEESNSRLLHRGSNSGLRGVGKYAEDNHKLPDGSNPFQRADIGNGPAPIEKAYDPDLIQAKNNESNGALVRKYSQWKTDIKARSSGKRQNNAIDMLDFCRSFTLSAYNNYT
jgi:hypothetical protein